VSNQWSEKGRLLREIQRGSGLMGQGGVEISPCSSTH
jgi:hypothetical protein